MNDYLPDTLAEILRQSPRTPTDYRLGQIADWSQPRYALDKRLVQLTLLLDRAQRRPSKTLPPGLQSSR